MDRSGILEIKKRFKIKDCSITGLTYAVVWSDESGPRFVNSTRFLTLSDTEQLAYLSMLTKAFTAGAFSDDISVPTGDLRQTLTAISRQDIPQADIVETFAKVIMEKYSYVGAYALLVFSDNYDIPVKDSAKIKTDESEEVYSYMAALICPIKATKAGLCADSDKKIIREADVIQLIDKPVLGMIYPSFADRTSDDGNAYCCAKTTAETDLLSSLFNANVEAREKEKKPTASAKKKAAVKEAMGAMITPNFSTPSPDFSKDGADEFNGNIPSKINVPKRDGSAAEKIADSVIKGGGIDANYPTFRDKEEKEDDKAPVQYKELLDKSYADKVIIKDDVITKRSVGGKDFFIVPADLIPYEKLEELLAELGKV